MGALLVIVGILAAAAGGIVGALTVGQTAGVVIAIGALVLVVLALRVAGAVAKLVLVVLVGVLVLSVGFGGLSAAQILSVVRQTTGPTDSPDPAAFAAAEKKLDEAKNKGGFRVQLTEAELQAVMQDALGDTGASPVRRIDVKIVDGPSPDSGTIDFTATFKGAGLGAAGRLGATLDAGTVNIEVREITLGRFSAPGLARGAIADLIGTVFDVNERLAAGKASLQSLTIGKGQIVAVGTQADGPVLTSGELLGALSENARKISSAAAPPPEKLGPGDVNARESDGPTYYVALGDSLAANVGVSAAREGYVSRLHKQLQARDGTTYGLRNFGVSGETSASLIRSGQLQRALDFLRTHQVAYVSIDIGANDLLGHLGSSDCSTDLRNPPCQERLTTTLASYRPNVERIIKDIRVASKDAKVIFLGAYNPFSLGFGSSVALEAATDDAARQLNEVARRAVEAEGARYADGQASMQRTTAATTAMLKTPPDIHPNGSGYDLLAVALLEAAR